MERRQIGYLVAALGALLIVVSALADPIGVGEGSGFGWKQAVGIVVGAVLVAVGAWLLYGRAADEPASES